MNSNYFSRPIFLSLLALLVTLACMTFVPASPTSSPVPPTATPISETQPVFTETILPSPTTEKNQEITVTGTGPSCTILQDLNLRSGPGMAYRPPIKALPGDSTVTPLGFAPQGIPGGTWAYVEDPATGQKGWISAGPQYISCTVELASLPAVDFGTPPPPPLPKSTQTSDPDGSGFCVDASEYTCVGIFSDTSLFQFKVLKDGIELGQDDGLSPVTFLVTRGGNTVYSTVENTAPYCILGGNGPCNGWVEEGGIYKWTSGGASVEPGEYTLNVELSLNNENTNWRVDFTVTLP